MRLREHRKDNVFISTVKVTFLKWCNTEGEAIKGHNKYKNMSKEELINFEYIG